MTRLVHRIGWALMGYPMLVSVCGRWAVFTPFWATIYRAGARLHNCH